MKYPVQMISTNWKKEKLMEVFILYRLGFFDSEVIIEGAFPTLASAEAYRDANVAAYVATQKTQRDAAHAAGEAFDAVPPLDEILSRIFIVPTTAHLS